MVKLIHFQRKSDFDLKVNQLNSDSIVFIKDTHQIWTHGQLYSCPLSLEEIENLLKNKADITDLSNVLAEEVIGEPLLNDISTLTREEIKKDLFIDMWNEAAGEYGTYNTDTGYFELNGLTDITYDEALNIYTHRITNYNDYVNACNGLTARTNLCQYKTAYAGDMSILNCLSCPTIIVGRLTTNEVQQFGTSNANALCAGSKKLRKIIGIIEDVQKEIQGVVFPAVFAGAFNLCYELEDVKIFGLHHSIDFKDSPLLSYESLRFMIDNANNKMEQTLIVHPDVYAKLTDTSNTEWNKVLTDAAAKQITFATV